MLYTAQLGINKSYHRKIAKVVCMYTPVQSSNYTVVKLRCLKLQDTFFVFSWHWCVRQKTMQECLIWMEDAFSLKLCHSEENLSYD